MVPLIVAAPLTAGELLMVIVNDVLVPTVPVSVGATAVVVVIPLVTVGITLADTTNSPDVVSTKPPLPVAVTLYVPTAKIAGVYVHVLATELTVAAPLTPLTEIVNDVLVPIVPLNEAATLSLVVVAVTVGTAVAPTTNSPVVVSTPLLPVAITLYVPDGKIAGVYVHVVPLIVAAPLTPLTEIVNDVLVPIVPLNEAATLSVVFAELTVGTTGVMHAVPAELNTCGNAHANVTVNSLVVLSNKPELPVATTS